MYLVIHLVAQFVDQGTESLEIILHESSPDFYSLLHNEFSMQIHTMGISEAVLAEFCEADAAWIAVAYFCPHTELLEALRKIPELTLIVSEEFTVNNPYIMESLARTADIRAVPVDDTHGKLHAKVMIVRRKDGSHWLMVGSANMTYGGFAANQEACVSFDSAKDSDGANSLIAWFNVLWNHSREIDYEQAKLVFDARSKYRTERRTARQREPDNYWILKSISGRDYMSYWEQFKSDNVVAIGWEDLPIDPSTATDQELRDSLAATFHYSKKQTEIATLYIRRFVDMRVGDFVFICYGYNSNHNKPVKVYGLARVDSEFRVEPNNGRRWRFVRDASIQVIEISVPRAEMAQAVGKEALIGTIHSSDRETFERIGEMLRNHGVHFEI